MERTRSEKNIIFTIGYAMGESDYTIAKTLGCCSNSVRQRRLRLGLPAVHKGCRKNKTPEELKVEYKWRNDLLNNHPEHKARCMRYYYAQKKLKEVKKK